MWVCGVGVGGCVCVDYVAREVYDSHKKTSKKV